MEVDEDDKKNETEKNSEESEKEEETEDQSMRVDSSPGHGQSKKIRRKRRAYENLVNNYSILLDSCT